MKKLLLFLILFTTLPAFGLQATINTPNSEVLDKDKIMVKEVSSIDLKKEKINISPNITYGLGNGIEVSTGVPIIMNYEGKTTVKLALEAKKIFYLGSKNNRLTIGGSVTPYLNKSITPQGFIFAHASRKIDKTGTTLSLGGYASGDERLIDNGGFLLILDQKLYKRLYLVSEYLTGNGSRANYSAGLKYKSNFATITGAVIVPKEGIGFQLILSKVL